MKIKFKQCHSSNFKSGRTSDIKYIVIHYTANNGDTAKNNVDYYSNTAVKASAHYFVDEFDTVYQSVKDTDTAWAVGASRYVHPQCRNANSISIEMCSRNKNGSGKSATDNGWYFKEETINNAVALTKELMAKYNIPIENVIRHYDVTGKICPAPYVNDVNKWNDFKSRITEHNKQKHDNAEPKQEVTTVDYAKSFDRSIAGTYKTTANLNLRCGAGTSKGIITTMPVGSTVNCYGYYTPINGTKWYLLKFGDKTGFASSKYLRRI